MLSIAISNGKVILAPKTKPLVSSSLFIETLIPTALSTRLTEDYIYSILIRAFCDRMPYVTEEPNLGFCRCKIDVDIGYFMGWFHEVFSWEIFMDVLGKIRYFVTHEKTRPVEVVIRSYEIESSPPESET